jgi:hypothetical protein
LLDVEVDVILVLVKNEVRDVKEVVDVDALVVVEEFVEFKKIDVILLEVPFAVIFCPIIPETSAAVLLSTI